MTSYKTEDKTNPFESKKSKRNIQNQKPIFSSKRGVIFMRQRKLDFGMLIKAIIDNEEK